LKNDLAGEEEGGGGVRRKQKHLTRSQDFRGVGTYTYTCLWIARAMTCKLLIDICVGTSEE